MSTIGDRLRVSRVDAKVSGAPLPPNAMPEYKKLIVPSFRGGMNAAAPPHMLAEDEAALVSNLTIDKDGALIARDALELLVDAVGHDLSYPMEHKSLDGLSQIAFIDPPYMGFYFGGVAISWINMGLPATSPYGWTGISVLGDLIFSDGVSTFKHTFGAVSVTDISAQVKARGFGAAFGRVFAVGLDLGAGYQASVIGWNAASGDPSDWTGLGSAAEPLISASGKVDELLGVYTISDDLFVVVGRNSLWIATRSGDPDRPANFREQVIGRGASTKGATASTDSGLIISTATGFAIFDGAKLVDISARLGSEYPAFAGGIEFEAVYDRDRRVYRVPYIIGSGYTYRLPSESFPKGCWTKEEPNDFLVQSAIGRYSIQNSKIYGPTVGTIPMVQYESRSMPDDLLGELVEVAGFDIMYSATDDYDLEFLLPKDTGADQFDKWVDYSFIHFADTNGVVKVARFDQIATVTRSGFKFRGAIDQGLRLYSIIQRYRPITPIKGIG